MNSYYDLNDKQRLTLSDADFARYLLYECMVTGALVPLPPKLKTVPEEPIVKQQEFFKIVGDTYHDLIAFSDGSEAGIFMGFKSVVRLDWDYATGNKYFHAKPITTLAMQPTPASTETDFTLVKEALKQRADIIKENEAEEARYEKEAKAYKNIRQDMYDDYNRIRNCQERHLRIFDVFKQYLDMANGDAHIATIFLAKIYSEEEIKAAHEWLDEDWTISPMFTRDIPE